MSKDINDNEIRIISSVRESEPDTASRKSGKRWLWILAVALIAVIAAIFATVSDSDAEEDPIQPAPETVRVPVASDDTAEPAHHGSVAIADTAVNGVRMCIFAPSELTPSLHVGTDVLADSTVKLVAQAADIRKDNNEIVGTYVLAGELLSKGQSKAGYCSIIGGKMSIGVADATPMLEQAIDGNGYFFRQYPLVVGGQIVENKPKGRAQRKALAELEGRPVVIITRDKLSFNDFSQCLVDLGVTNAIYLVGSDAYGYAVDADGNKVEFGVQTDTPPANSNYLVWR